MSNLTPSSPAISPGTSSVHCNDLKDTPVPERANILITGASSGLGAGMAREFAARGRNLALCARRIEQLEQLRTELLRAHPGIRVAVAQLDVNNHEQVFTTFRAVSQELCGLDRVIVNAGVSR